MDSKLLKSVFSDDPDMLGTIEAREQTALLQAILAKQSPNISLEGISMIKGDKGDTGDEPSDERLVELIVPLIPEPIRGEKGDTVVGPRGAKGDKGETVVGPKGDKGDRGEAAVAPGIVREELTLTEQLVKDIIKMMQKLPEKDRLEVSQLRNANSFIKDGIKYKVEELMHGGGGTGGSSVFAYDISSQFNGVATTFTVPTYATILQVTITGWPPEGALRPTVDFTTPTSTTIAINTTAPVAGTTGIVLYTV